MARHAPSVGWLFNGNGGESVVPPKDWLRVKLHLVLGVLRGRAVIDLFCVFFSLVFILSGFVRLYVSPSPLSPPSFGRKDTHGIGTWVFTGRQAGDVSLSGMSGG